MHQEIINNIFSQYKRNGYISEDTVFDAIIENDISLDKVDYICDMLLSMGVIIINDDVEKDDDDFIYDHSQTDYEEVFKQVIEIDEGLTIFIDEVRTIPPPQYREWHNLILHAQGGNKYARERIILMYLRNVIKMALYFHQRYNIFLPAAIQSGCIGLMIAIEKFEIGKQDNFSQYAPWWVRQYIMRNARLPGAIFRYPTHYKEKLFSAYDIITQHNCVQCSDDKICPLLINEISGRLKCDSDEALTLVNSLLPALSYEKLLEVNEDIFSDDGLFGEELDNFITNEELSRNLETVLPVLRGREQRVIELRFGLDDNSEPKTLEEIGNIFGVTRERIRQIEAKAIKRLRHPSRAKILKSFW